MIVRYSESNRKHWRLVLAGLVLCASQLARPAVADNANDRLEVRVFAPDGPERIRAEHADQAFVLMAWSLDCLPCHRKLSKFAPVLAENPDWEVVLVAVDDPARADEISQRIAEYGLEDVDHWRFGGLPAETLRHALDPRWFGELPRSWLFDADHEVTALSGNLPDERIEQHFSNNDGSPGPH